MRISPTSPGGKALLGSSSATTSISMPGSISPIEPGFSGPSWGWPVPGEQVSVMPQPLFSFILVLRSKILATSTGSGAPPDPQLTSDDRSRLSRSGRLEIGINIVGTQGNVVDPLTSGLRVQ